MIKGLAQDNKTLRELGVTHGAKVMVVGSKLDDVLSVSAPTPEVNDMSDSRQPSGLFTFLLLSTVAYRNIMRC